MCVESWSARFDQFWKKSSTHLQEFDIWILWQTLKHRFERHIATYLFRKRLANEWMNGKRWFETCGYQMKRQNQTLSCGNDDKIMGGLDFCNIFEFSFEF
eukprot:432595_1